MFKLSLNLGLQTSRDVVNGLAEGEVVLRLQASLAFSKTTSLLFVEFLFNLASKFITALGNGQLNVFSHSLLEVIGFAAQLLFNVNLKLLSDVFFQTKASSFKFNLESCFSLLEALSELLFKAGSNASAELVLTFGQQRFVAVLKAPDFHLFHLNKSQFHFLFEIGFNLSKTMLQLLVIIEF